jgi:type II secretory pathway pseudopilin PulG
LVELALVLMVLGLLSAYGVPKMLNTAPLGLNGQADLMAADLRRVQWMATTGNASLCVALAPGQYSVHTYVSSCNVGTPLTDPSTRSPFVVSLPGRTTLTDTVSSAPLVFNSWGQPSRAGAFVWASLDTASTVTVQVKPVTGWVSLSSTP